MVAWDLGLLAKQDGIYSNQPVAEAYLCDASPALADAAMSAIRTKRCFRCGRISKTPCARAHRDGRRPSAGRDPMFDHFFKTEAAPAQLPTRYARIRAIEFSGGGIGIRSFALSADGGLWAARRDTWPSPLANYTRELRAVVFDLPVVIAMARDYVASLRA